MQLNGGDLHVVADVALPHGHARRLRVEASARVRNSLAGWAKGNIAIWLFCNPLLFFVCVFFYFLMVLSVGQADRLT